MMLKQMDLIDAILKSLNSQGCKSATAAQMNAIIVAANNIIAAFAPPKKRKRLEAKKKVK